MKDLEMNYMEYLIGGGEESAPTDPTNPRLNCFLVGLTLGLSIGLTNPFGIALVPAALRCWGDNK